MTIERIVERIIKEAEDRAAQAKREAQDSAAKIIAEAKKEADSVKKEFLEKAQAKVLQQTRGFIATASVELRKEVLSEKQLILEGAFLKAEENLKKLDVENYQGLIERMILKTVETGNEEVIFSSKDKERITQGFIDRINQKLVDGGKLGQLRLSYNTTNHLKRGFILKGKRVEIDSSFTSMMKAFRPSLEREVAEVLFK